MTNIELCNRLAWEAGVDAEPAFPTTVVDATDELGRIVRWVNSAWLKIQQQQNWSWMWANPTLQLLLGQSTIAGTIPETRYEYERCFYDDGSPTGRELTFLPWREFAREYRVLNADDNVSAWNVRPDNTLAYNAVVSADKYITLQRYALPTSLAADADTPGMPADLHEIIVWRALVLYANFDEPRVQRETAIDEYNGLHEALLRRCLPRMELGQPLLVE